MSAALALGACTMMPDFDSFKTPDASIFQSRTISILRDSTLRPVTAEDLVDPDGRCAALASADPAPEASGNPAAPQASVPLIPAGIGLDMTECDVVRRAGSAEKVDFGTNERNERTAILSYIRGPRPGIYSFTAGRLTSIERAPEPPAPPKPARPAKPRAKRTAT